MTTTAPTLQQRFKKGDRIEVAISDAGEVETCFGRLEDGVGVFVRGMLAVGDRVEAEIYKIKKKYLEARLVRVLEASAWRVQPVCPHFGVCGGCKWQHVAYEEQLRMKRKLVGDALAHVGGFAQPDVRDTIPAELPFGYRNKVDFSFSDKRFLLPEEIGVDERDLRKPVDFALGFHAPLRYAKAVDIDYCYLATPEMNQVLSAVRAFSLERGLSAYNPKTHAGYLRNLVVRQSEALGEVMVNLVTSTYDEGLMSDLARVLRDVLKTRSVTVVNNVTDRLNQVAFGDREYVVDGPGVITEVVCGLRFTISANSFFQTSTRQAEVLYGKVLEMAAPGPDQRVFDLYCGAGAIALILARAGARVLGIEVVKSAVADAEASARANGIEHCDFRELDMKDLHGSLARIREWGDPDVVVVDPPRAGMHPKAVRALLDLRPRRIVYVSCKPSSLARDAKMLCEEGLYRLGEVHPVDMFPQTHHVEAVAVLERTTTASTV